MYIFLDNRIVDEKNAMISVCDRGFLYGDGIFETLRSYDGHVFCFKRHMDRMRTSASELRIPFPYLNSDIETAINELLEMNKLSDSYIRVTLSRGMRGSGFPIPATNDGKIDVPGENSTIVIQTRQLKEYDVKFYKKGMSIIVSKYRVSSSCPISRHKTANFLSNIMVREEAVRKSSHDALFLNTDGMVAECSASNIFFVKGGVVITPCLDASILPGITRQTVIDICQENAISIMEKRFSIEELIDADECFITNSIMEIMPVLTIDDIKIGNEMPGRLTTYLIGAYKDLVKSGMDT